MLVISRKPMELIKIKVPPSSTPTEIEIGVGHISPNSVRLGINAPATTSIQRKELTDATINEDRQPNHQ
jgi:carbon storage regulator CsrA